MKTAYVILALSLLATAAIVPSASALPPCLNDTLNTSIPLPRCGDPVDSLDCYARDQGIAISAPDVSDGSPDCG